MNTETEIYQILKKHKLTLKKREEVITDLLSFIEKRDKQLNIGVVMPELLCVDKKDNNALTRYYTYKAINICDTHYKVVDNYGDENWFLKEQFDVLT